jgi:hypothetical protein
MTRGTEAERHVEHRVRGALSNEYHVYANVRWTAPVRERGPARDGEADLVIVHPDHGLLVVETKAGQPSRDASGRWSLGPILLDQSPFDQARENKYRLVDKLRALRGWPSGRVPHAGHAVAFPEVDLASLPRGHVLLGVDAPIEIILDAHALESAERTRAWIERAFAYWLGDGTKGYPLGAEGMRLVDELLAPTLEMHRLLRGRIQDDRPTLVQADRQQDWILNRARAMRRVEVVGPAGSGKSMLAAEQARRLASEGYRTLLVCFNQRLATALMRELAEAPAPSGLEVTTFHRLCEQFAQRAGMMPTRPSPIPQDWWDKTLPRALEQAMDALPDDRYHAIVVDEGQDFEPEWLTSLQLLLVSPDDDVLWIFHDPGQALYRTDRVSELGLQRLELFENHRNPEPVAELAGRFYHGPEGLAAYRAGGLAPLIIEAEPGKPTLEALRRELHRLIDIEGVRTWQICVLSGRSATKSDVWREHRFGNAILWNEALEPDGGSRGLPPEDVPDEPGDVVLFETIRRFKGLEREVVVLVELPEENERLDELLYVALTRATTSMTIIAPPGLAARMA